MVKINGLGRGCFGTKVTRCTGHLKQCYGFRVIRIPSRGTPRSLDRTRVSRIVTGRNRHVLDGVGSHRCIFTLTVGNGRHDSRRFTRALGRLTACNRDSVAFIVNKSLKLDPTILGQTGRRVSFKHFALPRRLVQLILARRVCQTFAVVGNLPCRGWEYTRL